MLIVGGVSSVGHMVAHRGWVKLNTEANEIVCWRYDYTRGRNVRDNNFLTSLYHSQAQQNQRT